jgi:hypothetical protein
MSAALAVSWRTKARTGGPIRGCVIKIAPRDRTIGAQAVRQVIAANPLPANPLPGDLRQVIDAISPPS